MGQISVRSRKKASDQRMYCVCKEHVELAIDRFVDEYEDAPDLVDLKTTAFAGWEPPATCDLCERPPEILVV
jgi:CxxH/CxxC protein (TIGR04129 family)